MSIEYLYNSIKKKQSMILKRLYYFIINKITFSICLIFVLKERFMNQHTWILPRQLEFVQMQYILCILVQHICQENLL